MDDPYDRQMEEDNSVELKWDSDTSKKRRYAAKRGMHFFFGFIILIYNAWKFCVQTFDFGLRIIAFNYTERYMRVLSSHKDMDVNKEVKK